jgi:hypothetical protein
MNDITSTSASVVTDLFTNDSKWCKYSIELTKQLHVHPNHVYFDMAAKACVVVAFRGSYDSWAVNEHAVQYLVAAVREGKTSGYVVLAEGKPPTVAACKPISEVAAGLNGVPARDGMFGKYWWVDQDFRTSGPRTITDDPF